MSVEDLATDVGMCPNTEDYEFFIDDVCDLLNEKSNPFIDKDQIASLCERSNLEIAKKVLYKCYARPKHRRQRKRTYQRLHKKQRTTKPKWWQTYTMQNQSNEKKTPAREISPRKLPKGRQLQENKREKMNNTDTRREMNLQFSPKKEDFSDVPEWPGVPASPPPSRRRRRRSPSPRSPSPLYYRRNNKRRRR
jgi:hypothetical protein